MVAALRPAFVLFIVLSLVTGIAYPALVTLVANAAFPAQAHGSLVEREGRVVGSTSIGQRFSSPRYFWGRLSATAPMPYNGTASGGSNSAPTNPALVDAAKSRIDALRAADPGNTAAVPVDLATASGSGLDPHITPAAARFQAGRVARIRRLAPARVDALIEASTETPLLGLIGEPRVNVLKLNLALDAEP